MADDNHYWIQLHAGDFLSKTSTLSSAETGCFILLSIYLIRHKRLPATTNEIRRICKGETASVVKATLRVFDRDDAGYYLAEIEENKRKIEQTSMAKSIAGKAGADARWKDKNQYPMGFHQWHLKKQ